jgi:chlorophyll synthase
MIVTALLAVQVALMARFLTNPIRFATWYSALGVSLYVSGMLASAIAVRGLLT